MELRVARVADERDGESASIENQKLLLQRYVRERGWNEIDVYTDDGYSGTNFDRPGVQRLIEDAKAKRINVILVKDLSRFGRNYIETGRYLERIFPFMGVRFIAINDHYDSAEENDDKSRILIPFNNLINDTYCRDISLRVRSHLNELGVLPPNEYKRANGFNYTCGFQAGRIAQKTDGALIGNIDQFIGKVNEILFVVYTERVRIEENGSKTDVTRLISARMATEFERGLYYGKNE